MFTAFNEHLRGFTFVVLDQLDDRVEGALGVDVAALAVVHHADAVVLDARVVRLARVHHPDRQRVRLLVCENTDRRSR